MKIISIGDIHGRDSWKFITHGSSYEYEIWRTAVVSGASVDDNLWKEYPFFYVDKIIFVGDYVDSFTVNNTVMKQNLEDIIHFKKALPDKVVLLLGNHDIHYIVPNQICSGYRSEMKYDFEKIFRDNLDLFKISHEEVSADGKNWLWTHAGVSSGWLHKFAIPSLLNPKFKFAELVKEREIEKASVSEILDFMWSLESKMLFTVDSYSGGIHPWAGPIWVRPSILNPWPLEGYTQVVGHTPTKTVIVEEGENFKHYFIDCLEHGDASYLAIEI